MGHVLRKDENNCSARRVMVMDINVEGSRLWGRSNKMWVTQCFKCEWTVMDSVRGRDGPWNFHFWKFHKFHEFWNISSIIFESFSESLIKENKYSNINDRLVKHCTALLTKLMKIYLQARKYETFIERFTETFIESFTETFIVSFTT